MEQILKIVETTFSKKINDNYSNSYDGFVITTDKQEIRMGICNSQSCCENWGYFMSEDNIQEFVGANLIKMEITDTKLEHVNYTEVYEGDTMFVNIHTDKGLLQFVAYNEHNGYYSHEALVESIDLTHSESL